MKPKVYIETSVVSYLTARLSRDLIIAGNQKSTMQWWEDQRDNFDLYVSQAVVDESSEGDPQAARQRLQSIDSLPILPLAPDVIVLSQEFLSRGTLPQKASVDAWHIAIATIHKMDYLLTWNCKHIANATIQLTIRRICQSFGYEPPIICTPDQLLGE